MIEVSRKPDKHIFVCVNERQDINSSACSKVYGFEIFKKLKKAVLSKGLNVWVTKTGCMGFCNDVGATVAVYPDKKIFTQVKEDDVEKILDFLS